MLLAYILLTVMIFLWSFNFIVVDIAVEFLPVLSISLYRFVLASIAFLIIDFYLSLTKKKRKKPSNPVKRITKNDWILIIGASFIGQSLYFVTLYGAVDLIGPSLPALFVCLLSPVCIAIFALFLFNELQPSGDSY